MKQPRNGVCPVCGAAVQENARFCLHCMTSFDEKTKITPPARKKRGGVLAAVLGCALLLLGAGIFFVLKNASPAEPTREAGTETGTSDGTAEPGSADPAAEPDTQRFVGTDADTYAALTERYFREEHEDAVTPKNFGKGTQICFYDAPTHASPDDYFMYVYPETVNDISDGIKICLDHDLEGASIRQKELDAVLTGITPCIAAYLSLTEGADVSLEEVADLFIRNARQADGGITGSDFAYGGSTVSVTLEGTGRWDVVVFCKKK